MAVAAFPTWEEWRYRLQPTGAEIDICMGLVPWETSPLDPLRGDLERIMENVVTWALPVLLVLVGFLACLCGRDPRSVGRRTAGVLVLIAVIEPVTPAYASAEGCGVIPILSAEWFATVMSSWGSTQLCFLGAAALVLLTTRMMGVVTWERPTVAPSGGVTWSRPVALVVDYAIIIALLTFVIPLILFLAGVDTHIGLDNGILNWSALSLENVEPERLLILPGVFLYFWVQHSLWGQTLGKRLLRIRLVSDQKTARPAARKIAIRTLVFPLLVFMPTVGPLALIVYGLWALLDPDGRALHDRWANTEITRRTTGTQL
ncbi:RDD family protein [Acrocarpospora sp. B8E8]|uniref:RDD family protein n=1 Tax=Acrocarpospora sp. B8E8 TaxID=3153572 RepID=UPI00325EE081